MVAARASRLHLVVALVLIIGGIGAYVVGGFAARAVDPRPRPDFHLVAAGNQELSPATVAGDPALFYFGYTFCPDICPTELALVAQAVEELGAEGERLQIYFVSVDPERDTPAKLARYAAHFHPRFVGATGSATAIHAAAEAFGAYYRRVKRVGEDPRYYLIDHSAETFLLDAEGRLVHTFAYQTPPAEMAAVIRHYL